jgi:hypothetical protein
MWPGQYPIGKRLRRSIDPADDYSRVAGVVGDVLSNALDRVSTPAVYWPYTQRGGRHSTVCIVIQTSVPPTELSTPFRKAISHLDADVPALELRSMPEIIAGSVQMRRFQTALPPRSL